MNPATISRHERERENCRLQILDAAEEIFSTRGYSGATIEDIAGRAGFFVGGIYNFFKGKQDLFDQVLHRIAQSRIDDLDQWVFPLAGRPWEALRLLCRLWVAHHEKHLVFLHVVIGSKMSGGTEGLPRDDKGQCLVETYTRRSLEFFTLFVRDAGIRDFTPTECHHLFEGVGRSMLYHHNRPGSPLAVAEPLDQTFYDLLARLFRR
jgi:AcrR family transcriptional regulator